MADLPEVFKLQTTVCCLLVRAYQATNLRELPRSFDVAVRHAEQDFLFE